MVNLLLQILNYRIWTQAFYSLILHLFFIKANSQVAVLDNTNVFIEFLA